MEATEGGKRPDSVRPNSSSRSKSPSSLHFPCLLSLGASSTLPGQAANPWIQGFYLWRFLSLPEPAIAISLPLLPSGLCYLVYPLASARFKSHPHSEHAFWKVQKHFPEKLLKMREKQQCRRCGASLSFLTDLPLGTCATPGTFLLLARCLLTAGTNAAGRVERGKSRQGKAVRQGLFLENPVSTVYCPHMALSRECRGPGL